MNTFTFSDTLLERRPAVEEQPPPHWAWTGEPRMPPKPCAPHLPDPDMTLTLDLTSSLILSPTISNTSASTSSSFWSTGHLSAPPSRWDHSWLEATPTSPSLRDPASMSPTWCESSPAWVERSPTSPLGSHASDPAPFQPTRDRRYGHASDCQFDDPMSDGNPLITILHLTERLRHRLLTSRATLSELDFVIQKYYDIDETFIVRLVGCAFPTPGVPHIFIRQTPARHRCTTTDAPSTLHPVLLACDMNGQHLYSTAKSAYMCDFKACTFVKFRSRGEKAAYFDSAMKTAFPLLALYPIALSEARYLLDHPEMSAIDITIIKLCLIKMIQFGEGLKRKRRLNRPDSSSGTYERIKMSSRAQYIGKTGSENPLYKTELCLSYTRERPCQYGAKCQYAHSREELRPRPVHHKFKSVVCYTFSKYGLCSYGDRCCYKH